MYKRGDCFDINGFKYIALDTAEDKVLLIHIGMVAHPSKGKWIFNSLLPRPISRLNI
jgi:hypothetical protein